MAKNNNNGKKIGSQQSLNSAVKSICDIMRRSNCAGALQYVPELTWILFLRILDELETKEAEQAKAVSADFQPSFEYPYRWQDWAAPEGKKRKELIDLQSGKFFEFVNTDLLPHLKGLKNKPNASTRQKVISEILSGIDRVRIDTERNYLDVLDKVHELNEENIDKTHIFTLSQVYEGLLLKMGEKGNDGGQFFTPRQIIKAMVKTIAPKIGETVYDPGCGTGGFLAQSFEFMAGENNVKIKSGEQLTRLKHNTFFGREKDNVAYPIALANLILHDIDQPNIWHGNTLTGNGIYGGLFENAPSQFDIVLTNPPFGGKEGKDAQTKFAFKTSATQALFLQHIIEKLQNGGRCGMVLDEGLLFRTNEKAFVQTKAKLLDDCEVWCIVSLPAGVFTAAGAGVKTNLIFFTKGETTEKIWYYDLSDIKVTKKKPLTLEHFEHFFSVLSERKETEKSWFIDIVEKKRVAQKQAQPFIEEQRKLNQQIEQLANKIKELKKQKDEKKTEELELKIKELQKQANENANQAKEILDSVYDLKAVNPNIAPPPPPPPPEELIRLIEEKSKEVQKALLELKEKSN
jgi:type I restriction enzyme M protein